MKNIEFYKNKKLNSMDMRNIRKYLQVDLINLFPGYKSDNLRELMYLYQNDLSTPPNCAECNKQLEPKSFLNGIQGYRSWCSKKCYRNSNEYKEQVKKTSNDLYGTDHPFSSEIVQEKRKITNLERYGEANPLKWSGNIFKNAMQAKYGTSNTRHIDSINNKILLSIKDRNEKIFTERLIEHITNLEIEPVNELEFDRLKIYEWKHSCGRQFKTSLNKLYQLVCPSCHKSKNVSGFQFEVEQFIRSKRQDMVIIRNDRTKIGPYEIDVFLPELNLGIELHGDYWHCDIYVEHEYHKMKADLSKDFKLLQFFESEWYTKQEIVKSILEVHLNTIKTKLYARNLTVKILTRIEEADFFKHNHLQGFAKSSICYGLIDKSGTIVSAMSFGKPRFSKTEDWELIRYACKIGTIIVGGASKLLNQFTRTNEFKNLITYADRRISNGKIYETLGFTKLHVTSPNFWFKNFKTGEVYTRYQCQKKRIQKILNKEYIEGLTQTENMRLNGFNQISDAGNIKFVLTRNH